MSSTVQEWARYLKGGTFFDQNRVGSGRDRVRDGHPDFLTNQDRDRVGQPDTSRNSGRVRMPNPESSSIFPGIFK